MIKITDLFEVDKNNIPIQKPINRNAFTSEDVKYKVKCIKAMQDLGLNITIDKIGNICGTIPGKSCCKKSILCGSHTDSVDNGGQFDGPLGVYAALKSAEAIVKSGKQSAVNYKVIIYACEESTRFEGKACLGSKYLRGDNLDFESIVSREGISLKECIAHYKAELFQELEKNGLAPIEEVDRVVEQDEIITAIEGHIEQADVLRESGKKIGICTSIVAPYRLEADISDIKTGAKFICQLDEAAKKSENLQKYRATVPEFSIQNRADENDFIDKQIVTFRVTGESNHSGATPMDRRKDAVLGTAKFIDALCENPAVQFLETCTSDWGANQITNCCEVKLAVDCHASPKNILDVYAAQRDASKTAHVCFKRIHDITKPDKEKGLFIDIRQQIGWSPELSSDLIFETAKDIVHQTKTNVRMHITAKGKPYETNSDLVELASQICQDKAIPFTILKSWAGHDLATLTKNPDARTILLFCDNSGGSHNPQETTHVDSMETLTDVICTLSQMELERANQLYSEKELEEK